MRALQGGIAGLFAALVFAPPSHALSSYLSLEGAATTANQSALEVEGRWSFAPRLPLFVRGGVWVQTAQEATPRLADRVLGEAGGAWDRFTLIGRYESLTASTPLFRGDAVARYRSTGAELRFHFFERGSLELPEPEQKDLGLQLPTLGARIEWVNLSSNPGASSASLSDSVSRLTQFALLRVGGNVLLVPRFDFHTANFRPEIAEGGVAAYGTPHFRLVRLGPDEIPSAITGLFSESQQLYAKWRAGRRFIPFAALTHAGLTAPERDAWSAWLGFLASDSRHPRLQWTPSIEGVRQSNQWIGQVHLRVQWAFDSDGLISP